jgi:TatD DNase family protein
MMTDAPQISMPELIDSHCHLDDDRFDGQRAEVIARALAVGVTRFVVPATTAVRWPKLRELAQQYPQISIAYGLHPWFMAEHASEHLDLLDEWLERENTVAIGECGLDFYRGRSDEAFQLEIFCAQLSLAQRHDLPLIIHARKSLDDVLRELRRHAGLRGEVHSFAGSMQQARQLVDLGFKLGIAASISFDRAQRLRDVVSKIDETALLIESDAPDQPGAGHRGENNEPAFIVEHLAVMAQLRSQNSATLTQQLNQNCRDLFRLQGE